MANLACRIGVMVRGQSPPEHLFLPEASAGELQSWGKGRGGGRSGSRLCSGGPGPGEKTGWGEGAVGEEEGISGGEGQKQRAGGTEEGKGLTTPPSLPRR